MECALSTPWNRGRARPYLRRHLARRGMGSRALEGWMEQATGYRTPVKPQNTRGPQRSRKQERKKKNDVKGSAGPSFPANSEITVPHSPGEPPATLTIPPNQPEKVLYITAVPVWWGLSPLGIVMSRKSQRDKVGARGIPPSLAPCPGVTSCINLCPLSSPVKHPHSLKGVLRNTENQPALEVPSHKRHRAR